MTVYAVRQFNGDVHIYRDKDRQNHFCTFTRDRASKPTRRNRWINLNCYRWRLEWLPDNRKDA